MRLGHGGQLLCVVSLPERRAALRVDPTKLKSPVAKCLAPEQSQRPTLRQGHGIHPKQALRLVSALGAEQVMAGPQKQAPRSGA
eukprot:scaffold299279_cov39-Tisochrysis_lutea.AAC.2